jgi:hypothetical protein
MTTSNSHGYAGLAKPEVRHNDAGFEHRVARPGNTLGNSHVSNQGTGRMRRVALEPRSIIRPVRQAPGRG